MPKTTRLTESLDQKSDRLDRAAVLRSAMVVFSAKGFCDTTLLEISRAAHISRRALYKEFGNKGDLFRAAVQDSAEREAQLAEEPLRASAGGKSAIVSLLEDHLRLCLHRPLCGGLFTLSSLSLPNNDGALYGFLLERRRSIAKQIKIRLNRSVKHGELPDDVNVDALVHLCVAVLTGLAFRVSDGVPIGSLLRSTELFVNGVGFRNDASSSPPR